MKTGDDRFCLRSQARAACAILTPQIHFTESGDSVPKRKPRLVSTSRATTDKMRTGAFAMVDALGFRGIWKTYPDPTVVLSKLHALASATETALDAHFGRGSAYRRTLSTNPGNMLDLVTAAFLSDTIVLAAAVKRPEQLKNPRIHQAAVEHLYPFAIALVGKSLSGVIREGASSEPVLNYRGVVSFGRFEMDDGGRFIVGPAVDDAATHAELAQGAFVWLAPSALNLYGSERSLFRDFAPHLLMEYSVPMKGGSSVETFVVSPFATCPTLEACNELEDRMLRAFDGNNLDVLVKRQQTQRFLKFARTKWVSPSEKVRGV